LVESAGFLAVSDIFLEESEAILEESAALAESAAFAVESAAALLLSTELLHAANAPIANTKKSFFIVIFFVVN